MQSRKDSDWFCSKMEEVLDRYSYFYNVEKELNPWVETLKIILLYLFMGVIWVTFSDKVLFLLVDDAELLIKLHTYKGWFYVVITGIIFYFIISHKIKLFKKATAIIFQGYEELSSAHEELIAMEEELHHQYNELIKHRDALNISNQRYELVVEGSNDGIWDWDLKNNIDFFSIISKEVFGYKENELENTYEAWKELIHPEDIEKTVEKVENYLRSPKKGVYQNTYRLRCKDGSYRWILSRAKGIWDIYGEPIRLAGSHTDITELMELQESLHKEKELLQRIINGSSIIIVGEDLKGNIIEFNSFAEKLTGYTKQEVLGKNWIETFIRDEKKGHTNKLSHEVLKGNSVKNKENQVITKDGQLLDILWCGSPLYDSKGNIIGLISTGIDISEHKEMEKKLYSLAYYDTLTGLPNRQYFEKEVEKMISNSPEEKKKFMLVYIDLDNFKNINDTLGHNYGDILIKKISLELKRVFNDVTMARLGGDDFGIILPIQTSMPKVNLKVVDIMKIINKTWIIEGNELYITSSLGVAVYPEDGMDFSTLFKNADTAMYAAKERGKNCYTFYDSKMNERALSYMSMEKDLRDALIWDEFALYYQPIIDLKSNEIVTVEGLIRWIHPEKGLISPMDFIPFAEETGLIVEIGEKVIAMAFEQLNIWKNEGYINVKMAINLSARQLMQYDVADMISHQIMDKKIDSKNIIFEITENAALVSFEQSISTLNKLKALGTKIALDDFGTGYSSLNYLKQLPVDIIKIDKSFIKDICKRKEKFIAKTVIDLAHSLDICVTAEGIERTDQLDILKQYGCDHGQGYYFSKPMPAEELEKIFHAKDEKLLE